MKISSKLVGTRLKAYHTDISWRHTMNYAAAVGDSNPCYFDDERDQGIIAPPMFCVAVTWPVVERTWRNLDKGDFPAEIMSTLVHYTEHLVFHRPLTPGDSLTLKGEIVAMLPRKAGTLIVIRIDAFDSNGTPVFTEYNGGLFRGVDCEGEGKGKKTLPPIRSREDDGSSFWRSQIHINPLQNFIYDGCTNIAFPIHKIQVWVAFMAEGYGHGFAVRRPGRSHVQAGALGDRGGHLGLGQFSDVQIGVAPVVGSIGEEEAVRGEARRDGNFTVLGNLSDSVAEDIGEVDLLDTVLFRDKGYLGETDPGFAGHFIDDLISEFEQHRPQFTLGAPVAAP